MPKPHPIECRLAILQSFVKFGELTIQDLQALKATRDFNEWSLRRTVAQLEKEGAVRSRSVKETVSYIAGDIDVERNWYLLVRDFDAHGNILPPWWEKTTG